MLEPDMPLDWRSLFSGKGRVDRTTFWTVQFLSGVFEACLRAMALLFPATPILVFALVLLIASWAVAILSLSKRLHDLGRSGWWMLVPMAVALLVVELGVANFGRRSTGAISSEGPALLILFAFLLIVGLLRGNPAANRFGEPPERMPSAAT